MLLKYLEIKVFIYIFIVRIIVRFVFMKCYVLIIDMKVLMIVIKIEDFILSKLMFRVDNRSFIMFLKFYFLG